MKNRRRVCVHHGFTLLILSLWLGGGASFASIQNAPASSQDQEITVSDLLKLPGRVMARGGNTRPVSNLKVVTYRLEEVALPHPQEVKIRGRQEQVTRAFRITIIGGPFPIRAMPAVIWVGDEAVGYGIENEELTEITAVTYDPSLFRDGAVLYLSYGDKEKKEGRTALPDKLKLSKAKDGRQ